MSSTGSKAAWIWSVTIVLCFIAGAILHADTPASNPTTLPDADQNSLPGIRPDGNLVDHTGAHFYNAFRYRASSDLTVNAIRIKMASAGVGDLSCAIYADKGEAPGSLLSETTAISDPGAGWQTLALRKVVSIKMGECYWLVDLKEFAAEISCSERKDVPALYGVLTFGSWPENLPKAMGHGSLQHCIYACSDPTVLLPGPAGPDPNAADLSTNNHLVIDPREMHQTLKAWGISLCWWGHTVGAEPDVVRNHVADLIFSADKGLGINYVRYNIGGGENPLYSPPNRSFLQPRAQIPGYEPEKGKYNWDSDQAQRWMLEAAVKRGANLLEAFSNSPPYWMTVSGSVTGGTDAGPNLADDHDEDFAEYLATVTEHFQSQYGITFDTIEPFNEPVSPFWNFGKSHQEGCRIDFPQQAVVIEKLHKSLSRRGLKTSIAAADTNAVTEVYTAIRSYSGTIKKDISHYTTHSYAGGDYRVKVRNAAATDGMEIWHNEYSDGDGTGMTMATTILHDLKYLQAPVWSYWQAVDGYDWGLLANAHDGSAFRLTRKYHILSQFSRYLRPGCRFIGVNDSNTIAAVDPDGALTIVTINGSRTQIRKDIDLSRMNPAPTDATVISTSQSDNEQRNVAKMFGPKGSLILAPMSVTTVILHVAR